MKILIAPDKFKDSLSAKEVCDGIEKGIGIFSKKIKIEKIPLADGGEGSLSALENKIPFRKIYVTSANPIFKPIKTYYGIYKNSAFIELAMASGLQLLNFKDRNPMFTSSFGTGEVILDAISKGSKRIYLFIGGSATNDCGIGIASALGYIFKDKKGNVLKPIGENLININKIEFTKNKLLSKIKFIVLTDVENVLFGKNGAAHVYAKQKGANETDINQLDKGLKNISKVIKNEFNKDISKLKGGGAAGGIAAGLFAFCNAKIVSGTETILKLLELDKKISKADLVITGEGFFDSQTLKGKIVKGVVDKCNKFNTPVGVICGDTNLTKKEFEKLNLEFVIPIKSKKITKEESMKNANIYLIERAQSIAKNSKKLKDE